MAQVSPNCKSQREPAPKLLVSVRNVAEARAALVGGCDVLDVKEPGRGSLGMADVETIANVVAAAAGSHSGIRPASGRREPPDESAGHSRRAATGEHLTTQETIPVSAALGECVGWLRCGNCPAIPTGLRYIKLGLAGMARHSNWTARWNEVRSRFESECDSRSESPLAPPLYKGGPGGERRPGDSQPPLAPLSKGGSTARREPRPPRDGGWIAVAYADWRPAEAPPPETVIEAAAATGCAGVLFDTWSKNGRTLLDWLDIGRLRRCVSTIRAAGMLAALAGNLRTESLPHLAACRPDILAIRTSACRAGDRNGVVCAASVRCFREAMVTTSAP